MDSADQIPKSARTRRTRRNRPAGKEMQAGR